MNAPLLDMTPDGGFRDAPGTSPVTRLMRVAVMVAVVAAALAVAAFALWLALILVPVALGAAAIAWLAFRWRLWRYSAASANPLRRNSAASASNS